MRNKTLHLPLAARWLPRAPGSTSRTIGTRLPPPGRVAVLATAASILILPPAPPASAQVDVALTGGVNVTSFSDSELKSTGAEATWRGILGVSAKVGLHRHFGIEFGGAYSEKGGRWGAEEFALRVDMSHFEITAMGRAILPLAKDRIRAYVAAGPALAWASRSAYSLRVAVPEAGVFRVSELPVQPGRSYTNLDNFGIAGAAGLEIQLSETTGITLGVARKYGLSVSAGRPATKSSCPECTPSAIIFDKLKLPTTTLRGGFVYRIR